MYKEYLEFAKEIASYAGSVMMKYYDRGVDLDYKEDKTVVTLVDKKINSYLIEKVKERYESHSVNGEEESYQGSGEYMWVCDPLDGTGSYVNHIPVFVFSLALVQNGEPIVGVVYNANEDKMYTAMKGEGAFCNGVPIHVNSKKIGDLGYKTNVEIFHNPIIDEVSLIKELKDPSKISSIGSVARSAMAIAEGYFSCDIFPGTEHGNCDIAASYLIVTEAGGKVTDLYGNEQRYDRGIKGAIISNGISHAQILEIVKKYTVKESEYEKRLTYHS